MKAIRTNIITGLKAVALSFYSGVIYREVVREWKGLAYGYLFMLIVGTWIIAGFKLQSNLVNGLDSFKVRFFPQIPVVSITKGHVSIDRETPYYIRVDNTPVVMFDTAKDGPAKDRPIKEVSIKEVSIKEGSIKEGSIKEGSIKEGSIKEGSIKELAAKDGSKREVGAKDAPAKDAEFSPIVIMSDKVLVMQPGTPLKKVVHPIPPDADFVLEPPMLDRVINFLKQWLAIAVVLFMIPCAFVFCAIQTLIFAAVGKLFTGTMNVKLTYGELIRLSVMAMTPVLVLDTLLKMGNQIFLYWYGIWVVIVVGYLFFGVYANTQSVREEVSSQVDPTTTSV